MVRVISMCRCAGIAAKQVALLPSFHVNSFICQSVQDVHARCEASKAQAAADGISSMLKHWLTYVKLVFAILRLMLPLCSARVFAGILANRVAHLCFMLKLSASAVVVDRW